MHPSYLISPSSRSLAANMLIPIMRSAMPTFTELNRPLLAELGYIKGCIIIAQPFKLSSFFSNRKEKPPSHINLTSLHERRLKSREWPEGHGKKGSMRKLNTEIFHCMPRWHVPQCTHINKPRQCTQGYA